MSYIREALSARKNLMREISEKFREHEIVFCFIGGVLLPEFGYDRQTGDIDVLISKQSEQKLLAFVDESFTLSWGRDLLTGKPRLFWGETPLDVFLVDSLSRALLIQNRRV